MGLIMDRFTAEFIDEEHEPPQWVVVEWSEALEDGMSCGSKVIGLSADGEVEAKGIAYLMNINVKDKHVFH